MSPEGFVDSRSPEETRRFGQCLGRQLRPGDLVTLSGDLGAGKTCLVQGIALGIGVDPRVPVTSPSYTLIGEYPGRARLCHADFYRLQSRARLESAGWEDLLDGEGVIVVEWPERCPEALPDDRLEIGMEIVSEAERRISVRGRGPRGEVLSAGVLESCGSSPQLAYAPEER
jgi:tRNA threonylcarbamoyladenosine biosynthesis protein TsaE